MDQRGVIFVSIVCLLIALAVATEPGTRQRPVTGGNRQEPSLHATQSGRVTNVTGSRDVLAREEVVGDPGSKGERERVERTDNEPQVEQEAEEAEEYEGEDEYEDEEYEYGYEESHEAMSRDTRNPNASTAPSSKLLDTSSTGAAKNFDSQEVITVNESDEDVASNEAITDEIVDKYDQEVAELLKYKKERNLDHIEGGRVKTKRVPTVKKELSTQKEILIGSNETQVPKSLLPPEDTLNRLNEETEAIRRRNVDSNGIKLEDPSDSERSPGEIEVAVDNRYSESDVESPKKLDKRQETVLKDLKSYLLTEYATEDEQRQKLRQLATREDALAENVLKLLVKLAENPNRWERVQKLLLHTENELNLPRNSIDQSKRSLESTTTLFPATAKSLEGSRKSRKKLKKKKKKPRHRFSTTTLTPVPGTPPLLTTTETPWQTTPVQWRLVAERLFGPPWQQDLQEQPEKTTRYSQSPRTLPSIRDLIERNKPKSNPNSYPSEGRATIAEEVVGELDDQRLTRFGDVGARQPPRVQPHEEFVNVYDRPADSERMPDYYVSHHRPRYNQLLPASRDFRRRHEEDYQSDSSMQPDAFGRNQDYEAQGRDFSLSKSWPDIFRYNAPWKTEVAYEKWPWRQPQSDPKYWPQRNGYPPLEKSYWSAFSNEDDPEEEAEAERAWQEQRAQPSWDRQRPWPVEKPLKVPPSWQQSERPAKLYDRDQSNGVWEKSKNRSELTRSKESKEKVVLPQITMKTWNSLTSDPATWPHKLPGAKPWPKDENGKSYNPNADLVKKLGLDKQNGVTWSKEEAEKSNAERKMKEDKQNRLFSSKDSAKDEGTPQTEVSKHKSNDERSNFSDYRSRSSESIKPWAMLADKGSKDWIKAEDAQSDDPGAWRRKNPWSDGTLPKIQSVGAWVMAADQSTWKPYQIKPIEPSNDVSSRRWSKTRSKGSWTEKMNDSWMDQPNMADIWPGKSNKPGSWFSKTKDTDGWASKSSGPDSWKVKGDWLPKPESSSWTSKTVDNDSWPSRGNGGSWSTKANESWTSKINDDGSKFNGDSWSSKAKEEDPGDAWSRKTEQNSWGSKNNELAPWQQKMNDEWSYGKSSSTGTWPTKWKQFAYHRVTAMPISKPGTTSDAASSKSKNAFVAVSAVSSPKYTGNEWRKSEDEARIESGRQEEQERLNSQVQVGLERPIYAWKKDPGPRSKGNGTDPLENQLEALRQIDFWSYKENEAEKRLTSMSGSTETTSIVPTNSTSTTMQRRAGIAMGNSNAIFETNRRTISMK